MKLIVDGRKFVLRGMTILDLNNLNKKNLFSQFWIFDMGYKTMVIFIIQILTLFILTSTMVRNHTF